MQALVHVNAAYFVVKLTGLAPKQSLALGSRSSLLCQPGSHYFYNLLVSTTSRCQGPGTLWVSYGFQVRSNVPDLQLSIVFLMILTR
jgi:hypothetical protein